MIRALQRKRSFTGAKETVSMRLPADLYKFLKKEAESRGLAISDFVAALLDEAADNIKKEETKPKR